MLMALVRRRGRSSDVFLRNFTAEIDREEISLTYDRIPQKMRA